MPRTSGARLLLLCQMLAVGALLVPYVRSSIAIWNRNPQGSAGNYTALLGAVAMAWLRWQRLRGAASGRAPVAIAAFAGAAVVLVVSQELDLLAGVGIGCLGLVAALLYQERGHRGLCAMRLPLLLLLLAVPFPGRWLAPLVRLFLDATLVATISMLRLLGLAPEVSGYTLSMPGGAVTLVEHCSGLDGLLLFAPLTLLLLEGNRPMGRGRYLAMCLLAAPLAFAANLMRVVTESVLVDKGLRGNQADGVHEALGITALVLSATAIWFGGRLAHRAWLRRTKAAS